MLEKMELLITAGFIFVLEDPERGQVCDYSGVHNVSTTNVSARTIPIGRGVPLCT